MGDRVLRSGNKFEKIQPKGGNGKGYEGGSEEVPHEATNNEDPAQKTIKTKDKEVVENEDNDNRHEEGSDGALANEIKQVAEDNNGPIAAPNDFRKRNTAVPRARPTIKETKRKTRQKVDTECSDDDNDEPVGEAPSKSFQKGAIGGACCVVIIAIACCGVIAIAYMLMWLKSADDTKLTDGPSRSPSGCSPRKLTDRFTSLEQGLNTLQQKYATVDESDWFVVAGASWDHVNDPWNPKRPVVLLLVGQPGLVEVNKFAVHVARVYANVYSERNSDSNIVHIPVAKLEASPADEVKRTIDNQIKAGFDGCAKVALITDFDKLPPCSAILFHAYCDNDSAPFRDAVIIFTMTLENKLPNDVSKKDAEKVIQGQLETQWGQCPEEFPSDKMMAMHSRVTNNIVILK